jgi:hypothetical protein
LKKKNKKKKVHQTQLDSTMLSTAALLVILAAQQQTVEAQLPTLLPLPPGLTAIGGVIKVATTATLNANLALTEALDLAANAVVNVGANANVRNKKLQRRAFDLQPPCC